MHKVLGFVGLSDDKSCLHGKGRGSRGYSAKTGHHQQGQTCLQYLSFSTTTARLTHARSLSELLLRCALVLDSLCPDPIDLG